MLTFWKTNLTHFEYKQDVGKQEDIEVGGMQENLPKKTLRGVFQSK